MASAYTKFADICAKFYSLTLNSSQVSQFVFQASKASAGEKTLFVGGMFDVAAGLVKSGLDITVVDYSQEMVAVGRKALPRVPVKQADLAALPFNNEFDLIVVIGRVFTHMISDVQLSSAIAGCSKALRPNGRLLVDNYEDSRIRKTSYFNGRIECDGKNCHIIRESKTTLVSAAPFIVRWDARYSGHYDQRSFEFSDSMEHRAFSRSEFSTCLERGGFQVIEQGDNFDETSFYTLAQA